MKLIIPFEEVEEEDRRYVGGKGFSLAMMKQGGLLVPEGLCVSTSAYSEYVNLTGINDSISLELNRKSFKEMRWEEIWDTSLRIRNLFLNTLFPESLRRQLIKKLEETFLNKPAAIRSSSPSEDSSGASFAGLHASFINIRGIDAILEHIKLVWASLWSDGAILYRNELGLDTKKSSMAVVIQEVIAGERSGIVFSENPQNNSESVIEAVYGLNQGLVDGTIMPDRWFLSRETGKIISRNYVNRLKAVLPGKTSVELSDLPEELSKKPPLSDKDVRKVFNLSMKLEKGFLSPQDVEWTIKKDLLYTLQSRPITTPSDNKDDNRPWYMSLKRSFQNLKILRKKIEEELLPEMDLTAAGLSEVDFNNFSDEELKREIEKREAIFKKWKDIYWNEFIPMAHGMRLFGEVYNDVMKPEDPYEFMELLSGSNMIALKRNDFLHELALIIKNDTSLYNSLKNRKDNGRNSEFHLKFNDFIKNFSYLSDELTDSEQKKRNLIELLLNMSKTEINPDRKKEKNNDLTEKFLIKMEESSFFPGKEILDLGRASYRLRDDDNIYLGKIKNELIRGIIESKRRKLKIDIPEEFMQTDSKKQSYREREKYILKARQIVGQPAGPGIARGKARVINSDRDLFQFQSGEILVCDSIKPHMSFIVPLSSGIVERRGGMLIHGAIIAREYGIPCVTGAPEAAELIKTGDELTVDGYLGIVIVKTF